MAKRGLKSQLGSNRTAKDRLQELTDLGHKIKVLNVHCMLEKLREYIVISLILFYVDKINFFMCLYNVIDGILGLM